MSGRTGSQAYSSSRGPRLLHSTLVRSGRETPAAFSSNFHRWVVSVCFGREMRAISRPWVASSSARAREASTLSNRSRITAALGAGGMGEVYRATDTRLNREVALKLLPEAFVADPERLARFEREARLLASLN